jgi:hypothetical protein
LALAVLAALLPGTPGLAAATLGLIKLRTQHPPPQQMALLPRAVRHIPALVLLVVLAGHQGLALAQQNTRAAAVAIKQPPLPITERPAAAPPLTILAMDLMAVYLE